MEYKPWPYQRFGENHIIYNEFCGLFLDMGLGKTVLTLTAIDKLIHQYMAATKILVIAPKRVAENVWTDERNKWDHTKRISISRIMGNERQRIKAISTEANVYTISRDNVAWLVANYKLRWSWDMLIVDESSSFKNHQSNRFKALRSILDHPYRIVLLTGTPAPNSLIDLWAQIFLLDRGHRLGKTITWYRENLFAPAGGRGHIVYKYEPKKGTQKKIHSLIGDICISMDADDYLKLPKLIERVHEIELPDSMLKAYRKFEREKIAEILNTEITAINAAALTMKLQQYANGFLYDEHKTAHDIHAYKLEALEELIEAANGQPVLLFYWFKHDLNRILKRFKNLKPRILKTSQDLADWYARKISVGLLHPASGGHGLNLQDGGNYIIWYGPIWSAELRLQARKRLHRQGQKFTVLSHTVAVKGTIDDDIIKAVEGKISTQKALINAVKARISLHFK
jgi:SNF2 family DNA or RNA helicase